MKSEDIKPGDAVYHVSNKNFIMGVEWVENDVAECKWIDKNGEPKVDEFNCLTLRKVSENNDLGGIVLG